MTVPGVSISSKGEVQSILTSCAGSGDSGDSFVVVETVEVSVVVVVVDVEVVVVVVVVEVVVVVVVVEVVVEVEVAVLLVVVEEGGTFTRNRR